jgi:hypothetical protein
LPPSILSLTVATTYYVSHLEGFTGADGIGICTLYAKGDIDKHAESCALQVGMEWPTLQSCAHGDRGTKLYYDSVWYTSNQGKAVAYDAPGIPVIRIAGKVFKGPEAYAGIGEHICGAYMGNPPPGCGCADLKPPNMTRLAALGITVGVQV